MLERKLTVCSDMVYDDVTDKIKAMCCYFHAEWNNRDRFECDLEPGYASQEGYDLLKVPEKCPFRIEHHMKRGCVLIK